MADGASLGLLAIGVLLLVKEAGLPIPVPGDLVVIGAGVAAARGEFDPLLALATIVVAGIAGGIVQFLLVRGVGRRLLLGTLARLGVSAARLEQAAERLRRRGAPGVAVARATPGVRIVAIAASALASLPLAVFVMGLTIGNTLFVAAHFGIGLVAGDAAVRMIGSALGPLALVAVGLAVVGAAGWWLILRRVRRLPTHRQSGATQRPEPVIAGAAAGLAWADAACPACLVLGVLQGR